MSAVEDSCPEERESTASPPTTAHKRQRSALARFVKKIKQKAVEATACAGAGQCNKHGVDITPGVEAWRAWNSTSDVGVAHGVCSTSTPAGH